jgi:hypothetical protein
MSTRPYEQTGFRSHEYEASEVTGLWSHRHEASGGTDILGHPIEASCGSLHREAGSRIHRRRGNGLGNGVFAYNGYGKGVIETSTRPTLNILLLHCASV